MATLLSARDLRAGFEGQILDPEDPGYDGARKIWNGMIDRHPALIARCLTPADVERAVLFARDRGLAIAVKGGGHNVSGNAMCDDGLVIDLSRMRRVQVDPVRRVARAEGGVLWGEFDAATQAHGLATTGGVVTHTGIAGLTLGGGIGWLMRKWALTCDNLLAIDLVTADGQQVRASNQENADLFWGVRGGGGNFGVATAFEYALHSVGPTVLAGIVLHPAERARAILRFYRDFITDVPDELTSVLSLRTAPALPFIPEHLWGTPVLGIVVCYAGPVADGERVVRPLRDFGPPAADLIAAKPYLEHQRMFDPTVPHGWWYYWKSLYTAPLSDAAIDTLATFAWQKRSSRSYTVIFQLGGAIARIAEDAMAFTGREAAHAVNINAAWLDGEDPDDDRGWARTFFAALQPHGTGGVYVNFLGNEGQDRVKAAYGEEKYKRLAALKAKWDPGNVFRINQNIAPNRYLT